MSVRELVVSIVFVLIFIFFLSGSWRKWPLFGVSLCTLYCQIIITRQFLFEYMLLNSSVTELFHFKYYVGCFPYTRWDLEINKCVGKLHFFIKLCNIPVHVFLYDLYIFKNQNKSFSDYMLNVSE